MQESGDRSTISGLKVRDAMRRQVIQLSFDDPVHEAISRMMGSRTDALMVTDEISRMQGVVTKSDLMSAYFASFPAHTPLGDIVSGPPLFCTEDGSLESTLGLMKELGIHQVFVKDSQNDTVTGLLAYGDIMNVMHRTCCDCGSLHPAEKGGPCDDSDVLRFRVQDAMTRGAVRFFEGGTLYELMETLSTHEFWGLFMEDEESRPTGVISKTDLIRAYKQGVSPETPAREIMSRTIHTCARESLLSDAIHRMISREVHRLFVCGGAPHHIVGVISCTDAARMRSGSCRSCHAGPMPTDR
jgi:predicted transcriptional regulator